MNSDPRTDPDYVAALEAENEQLKARLDELANAADGDKARGDAYAQGAQRARARFGTEGRLRPTFSDRGTVDYYN